MDQLDFDPTHVDFVSAVRLDDIRGGERLEKFRLRLVDNDFDLDFAQQLFHTFDVGATQPGAYVVRMGMGHQDVGNFHTVRGGQAQDSLDVPRRIDHRDFACLSRPY